MKRILFITASSLYGISLIAFTLFWASNFTKYASYKGDEFFDLVEYLLGASYIFFISTVFPLKKINFIVAMTIPIISIFGACIIGILFFFVTRMGGVPRQYIILYGFLFTVLTLLAAIRFKWRALQFNQEMR